jgi:hypothetical protein
MAESVTARDRGARDRGLAQMRESLVAGANPDGGWAYYPGHVSRLEPTSWALLALLADPSTAGGDMSAHRDFLLRSRRRDGLLLERAVGEENRPNLAFNGFAALLLLAERHLASDTIRTALLSALIANKGIQFSASPSPINRQDNTLQGWAWTDETFSWVEPTCWCVLALKKASSVSAGARDAGARDRIRDGERLLVDRCCAAGGWNYGNANMLGQDLRPYVSSTALGLLAMQDRREEPSVVRSLDYLVRHRLSEASAMALALTLISLRVFGVPAEDVESRLLSQWDRTAFLGNHHLIALALFSLTGGPCVDAAFRV